jgi:hypothetical protein
MISAILKEKKMVDQWITEHDIDGLYLTIDLGCTVKKVLRFYHTSTECYDETLPG